MAQAAVADRERRRSRASPGPCGRCRRRRGSPRRASAGGRRSRAAPRRAGAVELDLPVDLGAVEHRALDDLRVVGRERVLTAARFVTRRPSRRGRPAPGGRRARARSARSRRAPRRARPRRRPVEAEALGEPHRADVDAEPLVDTVAVAERELGAAAAGVEDDERARRPGRAPESPRGRRAGPPPRRRSPRSRRRCAPGPRRGTRRRCGRDPQPGRAHGRDRPTPFRRASSAIAAIASIVRSIGPASSRPSLEPLAEPRDLGAVDDRPPRAVRRRSPTWNLTELVPTSITAYAARRSRGAP